MGTPDYRVERYDDDILVYQNNSLQIEVKRKYKLSGKLISKFYQNGVFILETTYNIFLFRKFLTIKFQSLPTEIHLERFRGNFKLVYNSRSLFLKQKYFKNPVYLLFDNNNPLGEVYKKLYFGLAESPTIYNVFFKSENESNFYLLLLFLINLPPSMDT